jgi:hypothetical protein
MRPTTGPAYSPHLPVSGRSGDVGVAPIVTVPGQEGDSQKLPFAYASLTVNARVDKRR